ncbi:MAG: hypothetical protein KF784_05585 [Fimbriimonadaceae bacterium]|nr:hypothetical protein [Fimbriimonadaceae bacterium]
MRAILVIPTLLAVAFAFAQGSGPNADPIGSYTDFRWMTEEWAGDERAYKQIASEVKASINKKSDITDLYTKVRSKAIENPNDPKHLYRWMLLLSSGNYEKTLKYINLKTDFQHEGIAVWKLVRKAPSPKNRLFARARFVLEAEIRIRIEHLPIAKRLHETDKGDVYATHKYAFLLACNSNIADCRKGIAVAKELLKKTGETLSTMKLLAHCYSSAWSIEKHKPDARAAISYYERVIALSTDDYDKKVKRKIVEQLKREIGN